MQESLGCLELRSMRSEIDPRNTKERTRSGVHGLSRNQSSVSRLLLLGSTGMSLLCELANESLRDSNRTGLLDRTIWSGCAMWG